MELTIVQFWMKLNIKDAMSMIAKALNDIPESKYEPAGTNTIGC